MTVLERLPSSQVETTQDVDCAMYVESLKPVSRQLGSAERSWHSHQYPEYSSSVKALKFLSELAPTEWPTVKLVKRRLKDVGTKELLYRTLTVILNWCHTHSLSFQWNVKMGMMYSTAVLTSVKSLSRFITNITTVITIALEFPKRQELTSWAGYLTTEDAPWSSAWVCKCHPSHASCTVPRYKNGNTRINCQVRAPQNRAYTVHV